MSGRLAGVAVSPEPRRVPGRRRAGSWRCSAFADFGPGQGPAPCSPLPSLHRLPRDASMMYGIGRVDISGRVGHRGIVEAVGWRAGDKLEVVLTQGAIVLRVSPEGLFSVSRRPRIVIPAVARQRHAIQAGDEVLVAAAPRVRRRHRVPAAGPGRDDRPLPLVVSGSWW